MGRVNVLVDGVSGTGKTTVCDELQRRGHDAVHGDRELAYQGDPLTGAPLPGRTHDHHVWSVERVRALASDRTRAITFFCGGSRNTDRFIELFDAVFVLRADEATLKERLTRRPPDEWGSTAEERDLVLALHRSGEGLPDGVAIDARRPVAQVVDDLLRHVEQRGTSAP